MNEQRAHRREKTNRRHTDRVIASYRDAVIRAYCKVRFRIINMRVLDEMEQYLPREGSILDIGCGFGLFSLYFAMASRGRRMLSLDLNARRVELARRSAEKLGLGDRTNFLNRNVLDYEFDRPVDAIFMLDILHHLPRGSAEPILRRCHAALAPGGVLLVKDVSSTPWYKAAFTWLMDKAMDPRTPVCYYHHYRMADMIAAEGFDVKLHHMVDLLPYPHVLFICRKANPAGEGGIS